MPCVNNNISISYYYLFTAYFLVIFYISISFLLYWAIQLVVIIL